MRREYQECFHNHRLPRDHRLPREPLVSDPGMHHGTCVTHVPWCMSGSLANDVIMVMWYIPLALYIDLRDLDMPCYKSRCRLEGFGRRCLAYAAPSLWNPLPTPVKRASSIDTFKSSLKTYLFNVAYPSTHWILFCMSILFVTLFSVFYFQALLSTVTSHYFCN